MNKLRQIDFQRIAVDKLTKHTMYAIEDRVRDLERDRVLKTPNVVFSSPTGSGKTIMMIKYIEKIINDNETNRGSKGKGITFLWVAPSTGKLYMQSYNKFKQYESNLQSYRARLLGSDKSTSIKGVERLVENTIHFIGWKSFDMNSKASNSNSDYATLQDIVNQTELNGTDIVLIVDEAHREYKKSKSKKLDMLKEMKPLLTIEVTATSSELDINDDPVIISRDDVIKEKVIKKDLIINEHLTTNNSNLYGMDKQNDIQELLSAGWDKIDKIKDAYKSQKFEMNPAMLIQIPDNNPQEYKNYYLDEVIKFFKSKYGEDWELNKDQYEVAIWIDKYDKIPNNKDYLVKPNSPYKFIIFKQAIATGWDIPRATVLVKLRDPKNGSNILEEQTIGRILRNPFFEYYGQELIDYGYIYCKDEKYVERIKNISSTKLKSTTNKVNLSTKSYLSYRTLNNIYYNYKYEAIYEQCYKNFMRFDYNDLIEKVLNFEQKTENYIISKDASVAKSNSYQTLVDIKVKFTKNVKKHSILTKIIENWNHDTIKLKTLYLYLIENYENNFKNEKTLKNHLNYLIYTLESKKKYQKLIKSEFVLPRYNTINKKYVKFKKWDGVNAYKFTHIDNNDNIKASNLENIINSNIYSMFEKQDQVIVYRSGENPDNSFYIEYWSTTHKKIKRFYPDYIIYTSNNVYIIEAKGDNTEDIDPNTFDKMETLSNLTDIISIDKNVHVFKAGKLEGIRSAVNPNNITFINWKTKQHFNSIKDFTDMIKMKK